MEKKDLRIGNIVGCTYAGSEEPEGWTGYKTIENGADIDNAFWYFPIPLTEEWLMKFGIVKFAGGISDWREVWRDSYSTFQLERVQSGEWIFHGIEIKHVNQLQNLYFFLTGQELTIK